MGLLDFFFPKKCVNCRAMGEYVCPNCFAQISFGVFPKCVVCEKPSLDGLTHPKCQGRYAIDGVFSAVRYTKIPKKLLYQFKYQPYLSGLQSFLGELLYEALVQNEQFVQTLRTTPLVVPIPLSKSKLRKRGYNQAELLAKELGKRFGLPVRQVLKRVKETKPQYGLKREERIENMKNAFGIQMEFRNSDRIRINSVILVDDVVTTGSTLKEAANVLKRNGYKKVWGVTFAQD